MPGVPFQYGLPPGSLVALTPFKMWYYRARIRLRSFFHFSFPAPSRGQTFRAASFLLCRLARPDPSFPPSTPLWALVQVLPPLHVSVGSLDCGVSGHSLGLFSNPCRHLIAASSPSSDVRTRWQLSSFSLPIRRAPSVGPLSSQLYGPWPAWSLLVPLLLPSFVQAGLPCTAPMLTPRFFVPHSLSPPTVPSCPKSPSPTFKPFGSSTILPYDGCRLLS